jgi:molybdopterin-synthase adenylyltransferase
VTISPDTKPHLPTHYYVLYEAPDSKGEEALIFVSERRRVKIKGTLFREFLREVVPLLDGRHTVSEIAASVADIFSSHEVISALELLANQHLLAENGNRGGFSRERLVSLAPQLNFFHEVSERSYAAQQRLSESTVSLLGLGGPGSLVAENLATIGVGHLQLVDSSPVLESDAYFDPIFMDMHAGRTRGSVVLREIENRWRHTDVKIDERAIDSEEEVAAAIAGSDLVICCLDRGQVSSLYKLNRASMTTEIPWISCAVSGFEVIVGPTIRPKETPCYLCYTMRSVACADDAEDDFTLLRFLDHRKRDDSGQRENLVFAAGLAASLTGLEALKVLTDIAPCATNGSVLVVDMIEMSMKRHVVLRHPRCPICFAEKARESELATPLELDVPATAG